VSPAVLLLVLYPVVCMAAPVVFYSLWPKQRPTVPNSGTLAAAPLQGRICENGPASPIKYWQGRGEKSNACWKRRRIYF
jgi:hypothetical protein